MERQIRNNRMIVVGILLISLISSWVLVNLLVRQVSKTADEEALTHIMENTEQLCYGLQNRIANTWSIMGIESQSLSKLKSASRGKVLDAIALLRKESDTNRVYLISDQGQYLDDSGNAGVWQLDETMLPVLRGENTLCTLRQEETGGDYLDFAVPLSSPITEEGYSVLMMEYRLDTFLEVLDLKTYGGHGVALVVDSEGRTLFETGGSIKADHARNYFFYSFLKNMTFEGNDDIVDVDVFRQVVSAGEIGAVYVSDSQYSHALSFRPLEVMDWNLMLMVEKTEIAGSRMEYVSQVQWIAGGINLLVMVISVGFYMVNVLWLKKRASVQLTSRERVINVLSDNSQGVYILVDSTTKKCTFVSQSVETFLGISAKTLPDNSIKELLDKLEQPELLERLKNWDGASVLKYDRFPLAAGQQIEEKYVRVMVYPPKDGEILIAILDETTEAQGERALVDAMNLAKDASRAKSMFLSNMSHDIRTPMNAIIGFTTLALNNMDKSDKVKDYLGKILSSSNHLLSLINDVLDMSRIESGKIHLEEQAVNLSDLFRDIKTIIHGQMHAKQLELYMDVTDVADEDVFCDKTRLNQVLLNLLSNAIKFTPAGGAVFVSAVQLPNGPKGKGLYEIRVKDTGIGMSPEFAEKIFEPFERERTSTVSKIQGTGLGMAITKNIMDMMGGTIEVHTRQGKGTEFVLQMALRLQGEHRSMANVAELEGLRALVAGDDFHTRDSMTRMLAKLGMGSDWTFSGKEAVLRARHCVEQEEAFDAYIIDWHLSDMDGIQAARQLRGVDGDTPIIILTANDWSNIEQEAGEAGVTTFCSKPIFLSDLRGALLAALGQKQSARDDDDQDDFLELETEAAFEGKRLLVVDDNEMNREIAVELLEELGFQVDTAENGAVAVDMIGNSEPGDYDLVLMDVQMPVMGGYEATKAIRELENPSLAGIRILAMTANAFDEDRKAAEEYGMDGFLSKPIDFDELEQTLHRIFQ